MTRLRTPLVALAFVVACGDDPPDVAPVDLQHLELDAVRSLFEPSIGPDTELASVDGTPIRLRDVALYLRFFPALTVEQALDDLIDLRLASRAWTNTDADGDSELELARVRARALTWAEEVVHRDPATEPPESDVRALADDPARRVELGTPPLATASHVLVPVAEDATDAERARALRLATTLAELARDEEIASWTELSRLADQLPDTVDADGIDLHLDGHITFPRRYAGPSTWRGVDAVVEAFADAAFEHPVGSLVGPVETQFGFHVLLVEAHLPGDEPEGDERLAAARDRLRVDARIERMNQLVAALARSVDVQFSQDAVQILGLDSVQRAQAQQQMQRTGISD